MAVVKDVTVEKPEEPKPLGFKDRVENTGKFAKVEEAIRQVPRHRDLNQLPKYKHLLKDADDPKKLVSKGYSEIEKAVNRYYQEKNINALQVFLQNFMYFPRDLVKMAEKYYDELARRQDSSTGGAFTIEELKEKKLIELMTLGNKLGLFFQNGKTKEAMIEAIMTMQKINVRRRKV